MDRTFRGLIAGMCGGVMMNIWSSISHYMLKFADLTFVDWGSIIIFGYRPSNLPVSLVAFIAQLFWAGFLGIILAFLLPVITSRGYLIKGALFGFLASFFIYSIPVLFEIHHLKDLSLGTAVTDLSGSVLWGITAVIVLRIFDTSVKNKN